MASDSYEAVLTSQLDALRSLLLQRHQAEIAKLQGHNGSPTKESKDDLAVGKSKSNMSTSHEGGNPAGGGPEWGAEYKWVELTAKLLEVSGNEPIRTREIEPMEKLDLHMRPVWTLSFQESLKRRGLRRVAAANSANQSTLKMSDALHENSCLQRFVVSPRSKVQMLWSSMGAFLILWDLITIPLGLFNLPDFIEVMGVISNVSLGFWLIDMPLNLIFGIETRGTLEMRPSVLARRYARSWLAIDVALVSLDITLVLIEIMQQVEMRSQAVWKSARFLRSLRLLRLLRLLRVAKLQQELMIVANRLLSTHAFMLSKVIVAVLVMLLVNHIIACLWYGIGAMYLDGRSWLLEVQIHDAPFAQVYAASLHWALTQFTPATNNIAPDNALERAFAVVVILLAIGLFSSCITAITSTMASLRTARSQKSAHQAKLFQFFNDRKLSVGLYGKVQEVLDKDGHFEVRVQERDVDLLQKIPQRLKIQLHEEMFRPSLHGLGIWPTVDVPENHFFYSHLCHSAMSEHIATPTQDAYIPGTDCPHVYIIDAGSMSYFCRGGNQQRANVAEGEILCLPTLWADWHHRGRLTANTTTCVYITLNSEQFGLLVSKVGGAMWQHLQILGILLVSEIENMDQNSCQRNSVSDLSLGQTKLDELVIRAERFASILKQNKDPAGPPDRMDSFRSRINVKGGDRSYAISSQLLAPIDEIFDPKSMVTATI